MKRKFKLITSVASLCLAVALMAFGVYAASKPTVTINGTVSFSAEKVMADVTVTKGSAADEAALTYAADGIKLGAVAGNVANLTAADNANKEFNDVNVELNDTTTVAGIKVVIKNTFATGSKSTVKITAATLPSTTEAGVTVSIKNGEAAWDGTTEIVLNAQQEATITIIVKVDPAVANASVNVPIAPVFTLERGAQA